MTMPDPRDHWQVVGALGAIDDERDYPSEKRTVLVGEIDRQCGIGVEERDVVNVWERRFDPDRGWVDVHVGTRPRRGGGG